MTDYYILSLTNNEGYNAKWKIPYNSASQRVWGSSPLPNTEDHQVLLRHPVHGDDSGVIEGSIFRIFENDGYVMLSEDAGYSLAVPFPRVYSLLQRPLSEGLNPISGEEFRQIVAMMGKPNVLESHILDNVRKYISARGYYFDDETIANYHICLKTRPFVILAGLSGTGKSKLSQLYAEALGHTQREGRYLRVAVRPSWNDDRYLLGYLNSLTGDYVAEPALEFIVRAEEDRDNLYFFCLDEMNLAHVEHYFSQFLSALEEEETAERRLTLYSQSVAAALARDGRQPAVGREALLPPNLLFTGTVNVDETTHSISDKVIDRANTLEFFDVALDKIPARRPAPEVTRLPAAAWAGYRAAEGDATYRPQVLAINDILKKAGLGLGYRVMREVELYLANSAGLLEPAVAFDLQVKQRILPRLRGTLTLRDTLRELNAFLKGNNLTRSADRLDEMETRLTRDGYTSFWR